MPGGLIRKSLMFVLLLVIGAAAGCMKVDRTPGIHVNGEAQDWPAASPEDAGMDRERLEQVAVSLADEPIYAMVVVKDGHIVTEYYKKGYHSGRKLWMNSVAKSVTSALVGMAVEQKAIRSIEQPISDFFPSLRHEGTDMRKRNITVKDLLRMSSGLDWPESTAWGYDLTPMIDSEDWAEFVLSFPMKEAPGAAAFDYNSGGSQLLSAIVQRQTGKSMQQFADEHLFGPLGIRDYDWRTGPNEETAGGFGIELKPRDAAKLGLLYLNQGEWEGRRLLSEDWIRESTAKHTDVDEGNGMSVFGDYGYHWWVRSFDSYEAYLAMGYGGQYIIVVPPLNLVVVFASDSDQDTALPLQHMHALIEAAASSADSPS